MLVLVSFYTLKWHLRSRDHFHDQQPLLVCFCYKASMIPPSLLMKALSFGHVHLQSKGKDRKMRWELTYIVWLLKECERQKIKINSSYSFTSAPCSSFVHCAFLLNCVETSVFSICTIYKIATLLAYVIDTDITNSSQWWYLEVMKRGLHDRMLLNVV